MPKFPDLLKNNNPNSPAVDLNDLQVKGVGIFADAAARDSLGVELHTEGYLAIMKDTDTPFIYTGGTWTDAANWAEVKGLWDEDGLGIKYTTTSGSVSILESTRPYQGNIITGLFGSSQSAPGGSRASRKLLHLHEGQLIFSTETNTPISHIEMSNQSHSSAVGGAIGTSPYNMRIHGYHALEFSHGNSSFANGDLMVSMDMPTASANTGSIAIGKIGTNLGGISLPSFGPGTVNTTNYSLLMGGRIRFVNHSNIKWDAITQGPSSYSGAGVALSSFNSSNILVAVSSDSNTAGSYGYVGINTHSPSATGPAFEVSSSYAKFNNGLHIGDITTTGYAFPTATGTTGQLLQVDANGDLGFVTFQGSPWVSDTNGITYTAGNVGIGAASSSDFKIVVRGRADIADSNNNTIVGFGAGANVTSGSNNILIGQEAGDQITTATNNIVIGYLAGGAALSNENVIVGYSAGSNYTGLRSVIIGRGSNVNTGSDYGVAIGYNNTVYTSKGVAIGKEARSSGVAIGGDAGAAYSDVSIGLGAGEGRATNGAAGNSFFAGYASGSQTTGSGIIIGGINAAAGSSSSISSTIGLGSYAFAGATDNRSIGIGYYSGMSSSGSDNIFLGYNSGRGVTGSNNVLIGRNTDVARTMTGSVHLGNLAGSQETTSNKLYIANSNTTTPLIYGDFDDGYVTINKNGTDKISFYAGSHAYQIADADYAGNYVSGATSNNKGLYILFEGTGLGQSGVNRNGGLLMGRAWNFGADPGSVGDVVILGNRITATATSGTNWLPGVLIGNDVDLGTNNHGGGVLIGNVSPSGDAYGVTINSGTGTKPSAGSAESVNINATSGSTGFQSIALGGKSQSGNVSIGAFAQLNTTTGNNSGVFIGLQAGRYENGTLSTIVGKQAGNNINGGGNTVLGFQAAYGGTNQSDGFSQNNTALGEKALYSIFGGDRNTAVGMRAGNQVTSGINNSFFGTEAGYSVTTGDRNVMLGFAAGRYETGSDKLYIANTDTATPLIYGDFSTSTLRANGTFEIGDPASTGYAFPTATGALDQILKVDANGDLVFGAASIYPWESATDSNGNVNTNIAINPTGQAHYGNVGIGTTPNGGSGTLKVNGSITSVTGSATTATGFNQTGAILNLSTASNTTKVSIGKFAGGSASSGFYIGKSAGSSTNTNDDAILIGLETGRFISGQAWPNSSTAIIGIGRNAVSRLNGSNNIGIGNSALVSSGTAADNTGSNNVAVGVSAGANVTTGGANVFLGYQAGNAKRTQKYNVIIGTQGGANDAGNTGGSNVFIGRGVSNQAGGSNTTGIENVFLGAGAGRDNTTGSYNVAIGSLGVGTFTGSTGLVNVAINGQSPGGQSRNVAILGSIITGSGTAIGGGGGAATIHAGIRAIAVGDSDVTGDNGIAMGWNAKADTNGVSLGHQAGRYTTGSDNISLGQYANHNVTGSGNISIGSDTLGVRFGTGFPVTSSNNIAMGYDALNYATDNGGDNVALGRNALGSSNVNAFRGGDSQNVAVGSYAGQNVNGSDNVFIGYEAGAASSQSTISNNVLIGYRAGKDSSPADSVFIGYGAGQGADGAGNVGVGYLAGQNITTGGGNLAIGLQSMGNITTGNNNVGIGSLTLNAASDSSSNVAIGDEAWGYNAATTGTANFNVSIGYHSGRAWEGGEHNTIIGPYSGRQMTSGNNNFIIGSVFNSATLTRSGLTTANDSIIIARQDGSAFGVPTVEGSFGTTNNLHSYSNETPRWDMLNPRKIWRHDNSSFTYTQGYVYVYEWDSGTQEYWKISGADAAANGTNMLGLALGTTRLAGFMLSGEYAGTITGVALTSANIGKPLYLVAEVSGTAAAFGLLSLTPPTNTGQIVRIVGYVIGVNKIYFNPSNEWIEL